MRPSQWLKRFDSIMVEILQNKNSATRFQILVEIAASGPNVQQRNIAARLGVTPQAISDYIRKLVDEEMVLSTERSSYRVSPQGVNWMLKVLRELNDYVSLVTKAITNITVCAAIAESDIAQGQTVGLKMKDGLLFATGKVEGAKGIAASTAKRGQDVDVSNIEGLVELTKGKISILQVPNIHKGGSRHTDVERLQDLINDSQQVGAIGIEALIALRQANIEPRYLYGVTEAAIEAAHCGLSFVIVCTVDAVSGLIGRLQEEKLDYEIMDILRKTE
ncbi:MAG: winged helix-turn-helix transcriptional regulator [Chloroflexi bacterium]|nr:winged helix-turn-helix transcriptional regulator [Chloroflexota bacterium]